MTTRVAALREQLRAAKHAQYRQILPDGWSTAGAPCSLCERKALALKMVAEKMPLVILDGELLVGSKTMYAPGTLRAAPPGPHNLNPLCFPHYATPQEKERLGDQEGKSKNHALPAYQLALREGLDGMRQRLDARMARPGATKAQREFWRASRIVLDAVSALALRYAEKAREAAAREAGARRAELQEIARVCQKISARAPETLQEAMQLYLFVYYTLLIEQGSCVGFGRVDQLFYPFAQGMREEERYELVQCFLLKLNDLADIDLGDMKYNGQDSMVLCGVHPDGSDATNALSYDFLRAFGELQVAGPMPCIRVSASTPDEILSETFHLNAQGLNASALYNDDAFVRALCGQGIPVEAAREWGLDLCQDVELGGASDCFCGAQFSLCEPIFAVLNTAPNFLSWEAFFEAVKRDARARIATTLEYIARWEACACDFPEDPEVFHRAKEDGSLGDPPHGSFLPDLNFMISPQVALSTFLEGCLESGRDAIHGGARFRHKGVFLLYPTNAINSLAAIHHCVYVEQICTLSQIREAIARNFVGTESLRLALASAPKWGNDDDRCDAIGVEYVHDALREINRHTLRDGVPFLAGAHQPHTQAAGKNLGATPDGRFAFEPVPVTLSPVNGTDINGPTAAMNSLAKLDPMLQQWNAALTLTFDRSCADPEELALSLAALTRGYFDQGGMQFQPNVLSREEMLDAQAHPENHKNLLVRVWGVSMYFVDLSRDWQDEILQRTIHGF